jgi:coiled-coil domain-containing protein 61
MESSVTSLTEGGQNFEKEWTLDFHGYVLAFPFAKLFYLQLHSVKYEVNISASDGLVTVEIEQVDANERWSGEFTSQCGLLHIQFILRRLIIVLTDIDIEEITHKAGSYKKYPTFVKMLCSAFSRESESVFVDLLTYNDLELLKARKLGTAPPHSNANTASSKKRYIILTYAAEFDRVHFPLPLAYEDVPNVDSLLRTIRQLRKQLREKESSRSEPSSVKEK